MLESIIHSVCLHGQAVKTSPSHGGIWGSIPHGGTKYGAAFKPLFCFRFIRKRENRHIIRYVTKKATVETVAF